MVAPSYFSDKKMSNWSQGQKVWLPQQCPSLLLNKTTMLCHSHVLKMDFLKPLDHLEQISYEFYNILTLFPSI